MDLSPHFTLDEMTLSQTAARLGLDNTPTPEIIENLKRLCAVLERIRTTLGKPIIVSSGYRAPAVNRVVGGALNSAHTYGLAADINVPGMTPKELASAIAATGIALDQIILEYDRWTHVAIASPLKKPRGDLLTIRAGTGYMKGLV